MVIVRVLLQREWQGEEGTMKEKEEEGEGKGRKEGRERERKERKLERSKVTPKLFI